MFDNDLLQAIMIDLEGDILSPGEPVLDLEGC